MTTHRTPEPPVPHPENEPEEAVQSKKTHMHTLRRKPLLRKTVATGLFVFGVVGIALPLLPGWTLIGVGLYLFSIDSPKVQAHVHRYRTKHSAVDRVLKHSYDRLNKRYFPSDPE